MGTCKQVHHHCVAANRLVARYSWRARHTGVDEMVGDILALTRADHCDGLGCYFVISRFSSGSVAPPRRLSCSLG
jgi:hypothetical protein